MTRWATLLFTSATVLLLVWLLAGCAGYDLVLKGLRAVQEKPLGEASNGKIAFAGYPKGANQSDVYVMNPDGTGKRNLTRSTAGEYQPVWSPDGQKIAFQRDDGIYVMNADGSGETHLTYNAMAYLQLAWSPDGQKIAFSRDDGIGTGGIYVINADGSDETKLTSIPEGFRVYVGAPEWSPDSKKIAFERYTEKVTDMDASVSASAPAEELSGIYAMNADGTDLSKLANTSQSSSSPAWSPDGQKIAFLGDDDIYVMNADGSGLRQLAAYGVDPAWSPDGKTIAFEVEDSSGAGDIYVMNSDGTGRTWLTDTTANEYRPLWSPDGQKIAFEASENAEYAAICVINADVSDRSCLANNAMGSSRHSSMAWARE